jgi:hypothetical protein
MELLFSNVKPCEYNNSSFSEAFELEVVNSDEINIATGYVSEESLLELRAILSFYSENNNAKKCSLVIGMHGREGFTRPQYEAAVELGNFLTKSNLGGVFVCTAFRFHGKNYVFYNKNNPVSAILGSSNLSNIVDNRQWEVDTKTTELRPLNELSQLHSDLVTKACKNILEIGAPENFTETNDLLQDRIGVDKADADLYAQTEGKLTGIVFDLPLKTTEKSNLNVYFGKGRLATKTGAIRPRHWYEVELIVPIDTTSSPSYPKKGSVIRVLTDDGWSFKCKAEGQNSKNFRSENDLRTLGRWIKGRLEKAGCLQVGKPVTDEVLNAYGRRTISLQQTEDPEIWLLDFSR